jgi:1,4-alpha-glucan branching enzyme
LEAQLADAGAHSTCVELTTRFGLGAPEHLQPLLGDAGVVLVPIDRATMQLVWSDGGYPADAVYRDYHHHTTHHHTPWSNDGQPYDHARALARAQEHAADFVARTLARLRHAGAALPGGGLAVCALDTELLGHWWYEGIAWLSAVVQECSRQGLELVRLDDALARLEPAPARAWRGDESAWERPSAGGDRASHGRFGETRQTTSWGAHGDLSTWSGPAVAAAAFALRRAELELIAAGTHADATAVRELLALQSSDWAFMIARGIAAPYAHQRLAAHRSALQRALAGPGTGDAQALRNIAPYAITP